MIKNKSFKIQKNNGLSHRTTSKEPETLFDIKFEIEKPRLLDAYEIRRVCCIILETHISQANLRTELYDEIIQIKIQIKKFSNFTSLYFGYTKLKGKKSARK